MNLENEDTEAVWAEVKIGDKLLIICSTYLPPHTPVDKQLRYLDQLTDSVTQAQAHSPELIIIMGDFNGGTAGYNQMHQDTHQLTLLIINF